MRFVLFAAFVLLCAGADADAVVEDADRVQLALFYEALCPACRGLITGQINHTWAQIGNTDILNLTMIPYGNAQEHRNSDGTWSFTCQHGSDECQGNLIEACIIERAKGDPNKYMDTIVCIESASEPLREAEGCVMKSKRFTWNDIRQCAKLSQERYFSLVHNCTLSEEELTEMKSTMTLVYEVMERQKALVKSEEADLPWYLDTLLRVFALWIPDNIITDAQLQRKLMVYRFKNIRVAKATL